MSPTAAPAARIAPAAVWTGNEMLTFGGSNAGTFLNDTISYTVGRTLYLYQRP